MQLKKYTKYCPNKTTHSLKIIMLKQSFPNLHPIQLTRERDVRYSSPTMLACPTSLDTMKWWQDSNKRVSITNSICKVQTINSWNQTVKRVITAAHVVKLIDQLMYQNWSMNFIVHSTHSPTFWCVIWYPKSILKIPCSFHWLTFIYQSLFLMARPAINDSVTIWQE